MEQRRKNKVISGNDGAPVLVKKLFKSSSTDGQYLPCDPQKIQSLLDQLKKTKNPLPFTYSKFITFHPPDEFHYTYEEQATPLDIEEIYSHAGTCISEGKDPCVLPLGVMATHFAGINESDLLNSSPMIRLKEKLKQISTSVLVRLTKKQKKYLAQIHQSAPIQHALSQMEKDKPLETFIHGDYRFNNILFRKKSHLPLLHIVDWEMAGLGPRVYDWGTLLIDHILVYLVHNVESKGNSTQIHWSTVEQLMFLHLKELYRLYAGETKTLHREYYQWLGAQLLLKGMRVIHNYGQGDKMAELIFQMGRRFVVEYDQLHEKYGKHYVV
ncbi:MAG: hypothetical protein A3H42_00940 [Deltaproteobacteria bacterium RIFCSPLOWO2_02_FULL_46_8]|nr:MAG: hypothetical protein A3H42_00940 [Deltaproteobacteria bacterium RIFCSPLOWO2_02_FULL_46_8]